MELNLQSNDSLPMVMTLDEVAQYLRRCTKTIRGRVKSGEIKHYKEGQAYRFKREWVLEYEQKLMNKEETA